MAIRQYVVDAFTETLFRGNPAVVCVMDQWLPDDLMQSVAVENCFSETAFAVKEGGKYHLRWFTPGGEIDLCGHATLATGFVIHTFIEPGIPSITFSTLSGDLTVACQAGRFEMCFPILSAGRGCCDTGNDCGIGGGTGRSLSGKGPDVRVQGC